MSDLPEYSDSLIALARAYDRAALSCYSSYWHFDYLKADEPEVFGDWGGLPAYAAERRQLLEDCLPAMLRAVNSLIQQESSKCIGIEIDQAGNLVMPSAIQAVLTPHMKAGAQYYLNGDKEQRLAKVCELANEHQVIVFDDEAYLLPKAFPKSFIEIWWRRWFVDNEDGRLYELCLVENEQYGWDCYGHER